MTRYEAGGGLSRWIRINIETQGSVLADRVKSIGFDRCHLERNRSWHSGWPDASFLACGWVFKLDLVRFLIRGRRGFHLQLPSCSYMAFQYVVAFSQTPLSKSHAENLPSY